MRKALVTLSLLLPLLFACTKSEMATRNKVRDFVEKLKSGESNYVYSFSEECGFTVESIPFFLEYADSEEIIMAQPSALSSYLGMVPLGIQILWYVESIRTGGRRELGGFVSLHPTIRNEGISIQTVEENLQVLPELAGYYKSWWKQYGNNPQTAVRHNPLEGTGYSW